MKMVNNFNINKNIDVVERDGVYYIESYDIDFLSEYKDISKENALNSILEYYMLDKNSICILTNENCSKELKDVIYENDILTEGVEKNATNLGSVKSWYKKFVRRCKKGIVDKKDLDERIKLLEDCIRDMKHMVSGAAGRSEKNNEVIRFSLKALIPFNAIYTFIKRRSWITLISDVVGNIFLPFGGTAVIRAINYDVMIEEMIDNTQEAVDYLKSKRNEF